MKTSTPNDKIWPPEMELQSMAGGGFQRVKYIRADLVLSEKGESWIAVSEDLPSDTGFYMVWCENDSQRTPRLCVWQAHWDQLKRDWTDFGVESARITHWMPMPKAPT